MMILNLLLRGLVADFHCLLGAEVDTGQALGAVRSDLGFLVNDRDVQYQILRPGSHPNLCTPDTQAGAYIIPGIPRPSHTWRP